MPLSVVILAAGQGTRMRSDLPKVLHPLAGRPMVEHVIDAAAGLTAEPPVLVYGHGAEQIKTALADASVRWAEQAEQLGTGHAVMQALPQIDPSHSVLVLYADVPLLTAETLQGLTAAAADNAVTLLTVRLDDPTGYGRIVRDASGKVVRIVEQKDASPDELAIDEINTGIMVVRGDLLHEWLPALSSDNAQGEYYLTDVVAMAVARGLPVQAVIATDEAEVAGVNDRAQLARLERHYQQRLADYWMRQGVSFADPARVDFRGDVSFGRDVYVDVNVVFSGHVAVGDGVHIGSNCVIGDSRLGTNTEILSNCVIDSAEIGAQARIGPFARVRPETVLGTGVHVGNFVEIKKSVVEDGSKINHLSYIGDTDIGTRVNVGAGTITCNYDGANKFRTVIEDDVFVGSDSQLVAPVRVGRGATIGAGTTVTRDVGEAKLVVSRVSQREIDGWTRPRKQPPDSG